MHAYEKLTDIDLADGDLERSSVQGETFGQSMNGMLGHRVWRGVRSRRVSRDGTVVDDPLRQWGPSWSTMVKHGRHPDLPPALG